jgi:hypothetical protein
VKHQPKKLPHYLPKAVVIAAVVAKKRKKVAAAVVTKILVSKVSSFRGFRFRLEIPET